MGVLQWEMVNRQSRAVPKAFEIEQMCGLAHKHLQQSQNRRRKSSALQASSTKTKKRGLTSLSVVPPESLNHSVNTQYFNYLWFGKGPEKPISIIVSLDFFTILHRNRRSILGWYKSMNINKLKTTKIPLDRVACKRNIEGRKPTGICGFNS